MKISLARVLCLFDYKATTGFATVSTNIVRELKRRFGRELELDIVPINYFGPSGTEVIDRQERLIVPTPQEREQDPFCRFTFLRALRHKDYDGYFIIQDMGVAIGMLPNLIEIDAIRRTEGRRKLASLFYFPVDSRPLSAFFNRDSDQTVKQFFAGKFVGINEYLQRSKCSLGYFDRLITYTQYGKRELLGRAPWLKDAIGCIPHGVDRKVFHPVSRDESLDFRANYFGANRDKFIIINVNRNQFRKDIPTTLLAFSLWRKAHPEVPAFLYLHMHPLDLMGWDLRTVAGQLDLVEGVDYGFPSEGEQNAGSPVDTLRGIYNGADLFVTTTTGEGWGLTVMEAMACGCPVIAPAHTSLLEMGNIGSSKERFRWVDPEISFCATDDSVLRRACRPEDVAEEIEQARLEGRFTPRIQEGLDYTASLSWSRIGEDWERAFRTVFFK